MKPEVEISPELKYNNQIAEATAHALNDGAHGLKALPGLLRIMLDPEKQCWKKRYDHQLRDIVTFDSFEQYVTTDPPRGLGSTTETLERLCQGEGNEDLLIMIRGATTGKHGEHEGNQYSNLGKSRIPTLSKIKSAKRDRAYDLIQLKKHRPDLYEQVKEKKLSANRAMIQAGFRREPTTVEKMQKLWLKMTPEEREAFHIWVIEKA